MTARHDTRDDLVTLADIERAAERIAGVATRTSLVPFRLPGQGHLLKAESLQPIGAFKIRGPTTRSRPSLSRRDVAASSPPQAAITGMGVAFAARQLGAPASVVMPADASAVKRDRIRADGANVVQWHPDDPLDLHATAARLAEERGLTFIHPFDDPDVIAGQGTVGLEIATDLANLAMVLVPVGGGGLISGVSAAVRALRPTARIIGVEPELAADARDSFRARRLVEWPAEGSHRTIADGTRTNLSHRTLAHILRYVDDIVAVAEDEIASAVRLLCEDARLVAEPSGALTVAALLYHAGELGRRPSGGEVVAVISGGNVSADALAGYLRREPLPIPPRV